MKQTIAAVGLVGKASRLDVGWAFCRRFGDGLSFCRAVENENPSPSRHQCEQAHLLARTVVVQAGIPSNGGGKYLLTW